MTAYVATDARGLSGGGDQAALRPASLKLRRVSCFALLYGTCPAKRGARSPKTENHLLRARLRDYTEKITELNLLLRRYEENYKEQQAKAEVYEGELLSSANYIEKIEDQLRKYKQSERQTKRQIRIDYEWDGEEANLSDKVSNWVKVYLFARYKFLKDGWMEYSEDDTSLSYFARIKLRMENDRNYMGQWNRVICPTIQMKYVTIRCNLNNEVRKAYKCKS
jgi:hypothetical protein